MHCPYWCWFTGLMISLALHLQELEGIAFAIGIAVRYVHLDTQYGEVCIIGHDSLQGVVWDTE